MADTYNKRISDFAKAVATDYKALKGQVGDADSRHQDFKDNDKETIFDCLNYALAIAKTGASSPSTSIDDGSATTSTTYSSQKITQLIDAVSTKIGNLADLTTTEKTTVVGALNELKTKVADAESGWNDKKTALEQTMDTKISAAIAKVVDSAPEDFDTFKEIATWIKTNADAITAISNRLKVNEEHSLTDEQKGYVWKSIGLGDYSVDFVEVYNTAKA